MSERPSETIWPLWFEGRLWLGELPPFDPRWPAFSEGVLVFETVGVRDGRAWLLERHLERLERAAKEVAPDLALFDRSAVERAVAGILSAGIGGPSPSFALRINLGLGAGPLLWLAPRALPMWPREGARLVLADPVQSGRPGDGPRLKQSGRWIEARALRLARAAGAFEALLPDGRGGFACGSRSNLYARWNDSWLTPPLERGVLPGLVRGLLLEAGAVEERPLGRTELVQAEEICLSNALWLLCPVASLEGRERALPGPAGPHFQALSRRLSALARPPGS